MGHGERHARWPVLLAHHPSVGDTTTRHARLRNTEPSGARRVPRIPLVLLAEVPGGRTAPSETGCSTTGARRDGLTSAVTDTMLL
jgi:hypothetical protein